MRKSRRSTPAPTLTLEPERTRGRTNVAENDAVTLVFRPPEPRGFTLLIDGTGAVDGDDVRVTPTGAVLHRPAMHADGPPAPLSAGEATDSCANDCAPVAGPG